MPVQAQDAVQVSQFSGEPVPRFVSLRFSAVHGRQGPSLDHDILWRYEAEGMPMLILRETHGWRRVRDKDGDEVWIQARMLSERRTAVTIQDTPLQRKPNADARAKALIKAGVVLELDACTNGWCAVKAGKRDGWIEELHLWGTRTSTDGV
ncbi:SH3 domain-containing protein [Hyphomonas sp. FCG-A18]|uniref:SH3 domain-containing protein n=1 Tax=Hyphomonas sp. FCG-A18 TaxID=3080019 RepID=UPI002B2ABC36|nr:SH3 domain-containing protein [Hyphomonas sp. FCG-A18]